MWFALLMAVLIIQRLSEVALTRRHIKWLLEQGAVEHGREHYPFMIALHTLFFISLGVEHVFFTKAWSPNWPWWLAALLLAQAIRYWTIATLGKRWTIRIMTIPGAKPIRTGPYRFLNHPNYAIVVVEILAIPMLAAAPVTAAVFSVLNAAMLSVRITVENKALGR